MFLLTILKLLKMYAVAKTRFVLWLSRLIVTDDSVRLKCCYMENVFAMHHSCIPWLPERIWFHGVRSCCTATLKDLWTITCAPVIIIYEVKHFACLKIQTLWNQPFHTPEVIDFCHIKYTSENSHDVEEVGLSMSVTVSCELSGTANRAALFCICCRWTSCTVKRRFSPLFLWNSLFFSFSLPFIRKSSLF